MWMWRDKLALATLILLGFIVVSYGVILVGGWYVFHSAIQMIGGGQ